MFLVEDTLFKVPRYQFDNSPIFKSAFALPTGDLAAEGVSDEHPIELQGIKKSDFEGLLKVLYNVDGSRTRDEYISALKLSNMWEFTKVRNSAIEALSKDVNGMGVVDKIILAMECKVSKWLLAGLETLVKRDEVLSREDTKRIGWEMAARALRVRDEFRYHGARTCQIASCKLKTYVSGDAPPVLCGRCGGHFPWFSGLEPAFNLTSTLHLEFQEQLEDAEM